MLSIYELSGKDLGIFNYFHLPFVFSEFYGLDAFPGKLKVILILQLCEFGENLDRWVAWHAHKPHALFCLSTSALVSRVLLNSGDWWGAKASLPAAL